MMLNFMSNSAYNPIVIRDKSKLRSTVKNHFSNDSFMCKSKILAFKGNIQSEKLTSALSYVKTVNNYLKKQGKELNSLDQLDSRRLDGILDGIEIFEGLDVQDLYLLIGTNDILLQRGCPNHCSHCYHCAPLDRKMEIDSTGTKLDFSTNNDFRYKNNINWDDFISLSSGIKELSDRLGFNPFNDPKTMFSLSEGLYTYFDAEPIELKSYDNNGIPHNIAEAAEIFYKYTQSPVEITTAGWDINNKWAQKAAEDLVDKVLKNPDILTQNAKLNISVHPFHKDMTKSIEAGSKGDEVEALKYRNIYINRMVNTLKTFLPLLKQERAQIFLEFAPEALKGSGYSKEDSNKLAKDLLQELEKACDKEGIEHDFITKEKNPNKNKFFIDQHKVIPFEKGQKSLTLYDGDKYFSKFCLDKKNKNNIMVHKLIDAERITFLDRIAYNLVNGIKKDNNFINKIIINIDPANDVDFKLSNKFKQKGMLKKSEELKSLYINDMSHTIKLFLPLFSLNKAKIRINYSPDQNYSRDQVIDLTKEIFNNLENRDLTNIESKDGLRVLLKNKSIDSSDFIEIQETSREKFINDYIISKRNPFLEILESLKPQNQLHFLKALGKIINLDGSLSVNASFAKVPFSKQTFKINDIKLNYKIPKPLTADKNQETLNIDKGFIQASNEVIRRDAGIFNNVVSFLGRINKKLTG